MPNSSRFVLPATTAPAFSRVSTTVALNGLKKPSRIPEAHVVGRDFVQILSLIAINRPSSRDLDLPVFNQSLENRQPVHI